MILVLSLILSLVQSLGNLFRMVLSQTPFIVPRKLLRIGIKLKLSNLKILKMLKMEKAIRNLALLITCISPQKVATGSNKIKAKLVSLITFVLGARLTVVLLRNTSL